MWRSCSNGSTASAPTPISPHCAGIFRRSAGTVLQIGHARLTGASLNGRLLSPEVATRISFGFLVSSRKQGAGNDVYLCDRWEHPTGSLFGKARALGSSTPQGSHWRVYAAARPPGLPDAVFRPACAARNAGPRTVRE